MQEFRHACRAFKYLHEYLRGNAGKPNCRIISCIFVASDVHQVSKAAFNSHSLFTAAQQSLRFTAGSRLYTAEDQQRRNCSKIYIFMLFKSYASFLLLLHSTLFYHDGNNLSLCFLLYFLFFLFLL